METMEKYNSIMFEVLKNEMYSFQSNVLLSNIVNDVLILSYKYTTNKNSIIGEILTMEKYKFVDIRLLSELTRDILLLI